MNYQWRFDPSKDAPQNPGHSRTAWINIDKPEIGSMQIRHETIDYDEIVRRMKIIEAAPRMIDALASFLRAPVVSSSGPGSVTIEVQSFNREAAVTLLRELGEIG